MSRATLPGQVPVSPAIPLSTHVFLVAVPALIAAAALFVFLRGGRRGA
jgi:hypothetical protein